MFLTVTFKKQSADEVTPLFVIVANVDVLTATKAYRFRKLPGGKFERIKTMFSCKQTVKTKQKHLLHLKTLVL